MNRPALVKLIRRIEDRAADAEAYARYAQPGAATLEIVVALRDIAAALDAIAAVSIKGAQ